MDRARRARRVTNTAGADLVTRICFDFLSNTVSDGTVGGGTFCLAMEVGSDMRVKTANELVGVLVRRAHSSERINGTVATRVGTHVVRARGGALRNINGFAAAVERWRRERGVMLGQVTSRTSHNASCLSKMLHGWRTSSPSVERDPPATEPAEDLPRPGASGSDGFRGFDEARTIMWCYEARARVHERFGHTSFLADETIAAVHVENTSRADRVFLTAFDPDGMVVSSDILYVDEPNQRLDVTPEFDHDFTGMEVAEGSELERAIAGENGWVVNMRVLREHDPLVDRRATQRAVFLAHLGDMMKSGQARGFLLGQSSDTEEPEEPTGSGTA